MSLPEMPNRDAVDIQGAGASFADPPATPAGPPKPLPEEIVSAWKAAGAKVGWARVDKMATGATWNEFEPLSFLWEGKGEPGDLPAFRFVRWREGRLAELPAPTSA